MAGWTVMTPRGEAALERAVFVRDGFNWWAALLGPFWALFNGMWIVAILLGIAGLLSGLMPPVAAGVVNVGLLLVAGIFAADLKIWSLARRGYHEARHLNASTLEEAEVRYFTGHVEDAPAQPRSQPLPAVSAADPLGLFRDTW